ncbi:glycoside hydrolase family 5 protein [Ruminococcus sp. XPD3002]|uniref:glycoside hydrolase family 5 protein n=1 Tax=Ruminococcus sp. XPD3002 TaxID=1452269 RepID=UPI000912872B|nr:glycoside hydrolase family 5 protein [Ruminococcus sp.]SFX26846.1 Cellulase (glycosyl hydrolase family 5) [Ruminococcus flavefaciens]
MLRSKGFHKGINLGGWMSQCDYSKERLDNFITSSDIEQIARWGFDHVRIPIDYNILQNSDGTIKENGFARIEKAVAQCEKHGLKVILDLHKTAGFSFDEGETECGFFDSRKYQEMFYRLWEEFARRFGNDSDNVVFELLNEVTDKSYINKWNSISNECIRRIRKFAPDTVILVGSYNNNGVKEVRFLDKPYDRNIVYNFHCYEPLLFTHQGATWTVKIDPEKRMSYENSGTSEEYFEQLFSSAISKAEADGTSLYCGEYGMIDVASAQDSLKWFRAINNVFEKHHIARSVWNYKEMDFGISDPKYDGIRSELLKYL